MNFKFNKIFILTALLLLINTACPWLNDGHFICTKTAVNNLPANIPEFFKTGKNTIAHCSLDPDTFKKPFAGNELHSTEGPEHYIDIELLKGASIPLTRYAFFKWCCSNNASPEKIGCVSYSIMEWTERLAVSFAEHRRWPDNNSIKQKCLVYAGILAHYSEDACQPLHTTVYYDGKNSGKGIHMKTDALLEKIKNPDSIKIKKSRIKAFDNLYAGITEAIMSSHNLVDKVYSLEKKIPAKDAPLDDKDVINFTEERFSSAAVFTASLYLTAWELSKNIQMPSWHNRDE